MNKNNLTIFHNPSCSKSRETMEILESSGTAPEIVEYLNTPPTREQLAEVLQKLGIPARELVRTGEKTWLDLGLDLDDMSDESIIDTICNHPVLLQRPIIVCGNQAVIGRPPTRVLEIL